MDTSLSLEATDIAWRAAEALGELAADVEGQACALCGEDLDDHQLRYSMVSPWTAEKRLSVCHTCRRACLGEGYRPAA